MPDICIVPNCSSNSSGNKGYVRCFTFPADEKQREEWIRRIPRSKSFNVTRNTNVCVNHFEDQFLIKGLKYIGKDGTQQFMENKTWRLVPNAVPTIFPVISQKNTKRRKSPPVENETDVVVHSVKTQKKRKIEKEAAIEEITSQRADVNEKTECYSCGFTDRLYKLFRAPSCPQMRKTWMKIIPNANRSMFTEEFRLCARHFEKKLIISNMFLLKSAIPSRFRFDDNICREIQVSDATQIPNIPSNQIEDIPSTSTVIPKLDSEFTTPPPSRDSSVMQSSRESSPQPYLDDSNGLSDSQAFLFKEIESTVENFADRKSPDVIFDRLISEKREKKSPKIASKKPNNSQKSKARFRYAGDVDPLKDYSLEESIEAIATIKSDLARIESKTNIIQRKVDVVKMKISTYQQFIAKLVARTIISKESAKLLQVLPRDVRRKERIDMRKKIKNGNYPKALATDHDHDYL